uniref:Target of Myb protein 1 isoform X2 n=1 Tax=Geotrypetes seraphini TaxID=260995 RepID=A0A6P8PND4_GEOSA|nr:target of Myb protein 1 isoform X2 [Geotrypetes seraphini]
MEFLLGNPFSSPVGQRIEKATDGSLQSEDWALNMEICDIINETEEGPKDAARALKKRIVGNRNFHEVMLALTVLETCVKNCGHRFHIFVANQEFVDNALVKTILPKNNPPNIVHDKVLTLIQAWADAFRSSPDLTGVVTVYEDLRRKGLEFPMTDLDTLSPIHTPQRSVYSPDSVARQSTVSGDSPVRAGPPSQTAAPCTTEPGLPNESPITPTSEQVAKLRSELEMVNGNVRVISEMLTVLVPGQVAPSDLELLQELNRTCRTMQQRVLELIPRVSNEQVTEELLIVNDNLNNAFLRYERFERFHLGQVMPAAAPSKVLSETEAASPLVSLAPGAPVAQSDVSSLSSQLVRMHVSSDTMSGTLQSLEAPVKPQDDFDMFALTRSSSLADQRKSVKYEDPQAATGLAGALDTRQQNTGAMESDTALDNSAILNNWMARQGMIPATQACLMDDIEKWLSTDVQEDMQGTEGVTSEEFDKFLEERAKAADRLPNLPSPPAEQPGPAPNASHSKREKEDDSMFAL